MDRRALLRGLWLGPLLAVPRSAWAARVELSVIVAPASPLKDLKISDLRRIFAGEVVKDDEDNKVIPLNHPPKTADRVGFDKLVLEMDPDQVGQYWLDRRIRGQPGPPRTVDSLHLLIKVVARLPGAIGYVRSQHVTDEVRALKIGGKARGTAGYPLIYGD